MINSRQNLLNKSLKAGGIVFAFAGAQMVLGIVTQIVLARTISPDTFGLAAIVLAITMFFTTSSTLGGDKFFFVDKKERLDQIISVEIGFALVVGISGLFIIPATLNFIGRSDLLLYCLFFLPVVFYNPLVRHRAIFEKELVFYKARLPYFLAHVASSILALVIAFSGGDIWAVLLWRFGALILEVLFLWIIAPRAFKLLIPNRIFLHKFLRFGAPLTISVAAVYFYSNVDYYLLANFITAKELGFYWLAYQFNQYLLQARKLIVSVLIPVFAKLDDYSDLELAFNYITKILILLYSIPFLFMCIYGESIIMFVFGQNWLEALYPFIIFSFISVLRASTTLLEPVCIKNMKTNRLMEITLLSCVLIPVIGYFFTVWYGALGMALAVLLSVLITTFYSVVILKGMLKFSVFTTYLGPILFVVQALGALFTLDWLLASTDIINETLRPFIVVVVGILLFILINYRLLTQCIHLVRSIGFNKRKI